MKRIVSLILSLLVTLSTISPTIAQAIGEANKVSTTIKAKVKVNDDKLKGKKFKFALYGENITDYPIQVVESDINGDITFNPVQFTSPGEYKFKIVQQELQGENSNLIYDKKEKEITVRLTQGDFKVIQENKKYYGTAPPGEHIIMGENVGGNDFQVFCIDNTKSLPPQTATSKEYTAITDPDHNTLKGMVTHNLWGAELSTVLKKIFFFFQAHPNRFDVKTQHNIVWAATGAYGDTQDSMAQYGDYMAEINRVTLPDEYHLVVFHPVEALIPANPDEPGSQDLYYQDLAMGYGATIENTTIPDKPTAEIPIFVNSIKSDPVVPTPNPDKNNKIFISFSKLKEDGNNLKGANLAIKDSKNTEVVNWTSSNGNKILELESGEYTLYEKSAPQNYVIAKPINFRVSNIGKVEVKGDNGEYNTLLKDDFISYESYTKKSEYGEEIDGHYVDNIYVKPIGGDNSQEMVGYCFNSDKRPPEESPDNLREGKYEKLEEKDFKALVGAKSKVPTNEALVALVKEAVWKGYPNNKTNLQGNISNERFRALTQAAIWLFTDDKKLDEIPYFRDDYSPEEKAVYDKLINQDTAVPGDFKLNIYKSSNPNYQNVLSSRYTNGETLIPDIKMVDKKLTTPVHNDVELLIKKVSKSTGNQLNGAKLALFKGEGILGEKVKDINTTDTAEKIKLENGVYTLSEIVAPEGYKKAEDIIFKAEKGKLYLKEGKIFKEYENYEEVDSNNYEAFSDRNDDSFQWQFAPYGKHYYLKENGGKGQALYCFNIDRHEPAESYDDGQTIEYNPFDGGEVKYTKILNLEGLIDNSEKPRIKNPQQFHESIRKVIYAGYPNNNIGMGNGLSNTTFKAITQLAIYYFTDSIDINTVEHGFEGIRLPENKAVMQAYKNLVSYAENQEIKVPADFKLNIYKSNNGKYQNLIGTKYNPEGLLYTITMIDEDASNKKRSNI